MVRVSRNSPALRESHVLELFKTPTPPCPDSAQGYIEICGNLGLSQPVIIRQFQALALVLHEPCQGRHAPGSLLRSLQSARCTSSACVPLVQSDVYTKALQVIGAGLAKLLVSLYMRGALIPTVRERVVTAHGMWRLSKQVSQDWTPQRIEIEFRHPLHHLHRLHQPYR